MFPLLALTLGCLRASAAGVAARSGRPSSSEPGADVLFKFQTGTSSSLLSFVSI